MINEIAPLKVPVYILSALKVFFIEGEAEEAAESSPSTCFRGVLILFNSIDCGSLSFQVSQFLNTGIERQHLYLSYKLLTTPATLFLHILLIDSHS